MIHSASRLVRAEAKAREVGAAIAPVHTTILVPAYNEEQALPHVLEAIFAVIDDGYEVLIVDDGSKDNTRTVAETYPCRIISHQVNRGKGGAMKTGFINARGTKIIVIDGDATYPADAIPLIVEQLDHHDMVRCVRSEGRDNMPLVNRIGNLFFDQMIRRMHQVEGGDVLSGLYGLHRHHLLAMRLECEGFDIESEILIKSQAMQLIAHTIPISYSERIGEKKLKPVKDGMKILMRITTLALRYNPFMIYIVPGLALWVLAVIALLLLSQGPIRTPFAGFSTHSLILSAMSFLAGFQIIVFGCAVNVYVAESGLGRPSKILSMFAIHFPRFYGGIAGLLVSAIATGWCLLLMINWFWGGMKDFIYTDQLVIALSLIVWSVQLISAMLFLSIFASLARYQSTNPTQKLS
jgi:hypothetical protein